MRRQALVALALAAALWPALVAHAQRPLTHEQALEALKKPDDIESRRLGGAWLGETGLMADVQPLIEALKDPDYGVRVLAERSLWQVWSRSGDLEVDHLFQIGLERMREPAPQAAIRTFSEVIQKKPEFAEGWNKRATVYYLIGEYDKSLADCEEVIKRNPLHFGALSGFGMNYIQLRQLENALEYFQRALRVNPNLEQVEATVAALKELLLQQKLDSI